jgi:hypothetical protein
MPQYPAVIDLGGLNGSNGYRLDGLDGQDIAGVSIAGAGDLNRDGYQDFIIGASGADPGGDNIAGETYVVFGRPTGVIGAALDLSTLNGTNGFRIDGIDAYDNSGFSVSGAGDINGDGFADLLIGARGGDPGGDDGAGEAYVIFGRASGFSAAIDLSALNGTNGFRLEGVNAADSAGWSVASAGDVNGDGFADLMIGAPYATVGGDSGAGATYVVFGRAAAFPAVFDLSTLNGTNGFRLDGIDAYDLSGLSVAGAGDINGDGFADLLIGAYGGDPGGDSYAGETYVVFGRASGFGAALDLSSLNGTNGFRIAGIDANDNSGFSVSGAGDINGDGFADLLIGAYGGDPGGDDGAGEAYVVFGRASGFGTAFDLATLDGTNGFRIDGLDAGDFTGFQVSSAGDFNLDGFSDILIGASGGDPGGDSGAGEAYVIFGRASGFSPALDLSTLNGDNGLRIDGIDAFDAAGRSLSSADVNGDGFSDLLIGASYGDPGGDNNAGEAYVVFGGPPGQAVVRTGTSVANRIAGGNFNDTLIGLAGNDRLFGLDGADILIGGDGADVLLGGAGGDFLDPGAAVGDYVDGEAGFDVASYLNAGFSAINLTNQALNNYGAEGDQIFNIEAFYLSNSAIGDNFVNDNTGRYIYGFAGNDAIIGGAGSDFVDGGAGADQIFLQGGFDYASYNTAAAGVAVNLLNTSLNTGEAAGDSYAGVEAFILSESGDFFTGAAGQNFAFGYGGNDTLSAGANSSDWLIGGAGNDILYGGVFADLLAGDAGADLYNYRATNEGGDSILNFETGVDAFYLLASAFGFAAGASLVAGQNFIAGASPLPTTAGPTFLYATGAGLLYFDADGSGAGASVLIAQIFGAPSLAAADFVFYS